MITAWLLYNECDSLINTACINMFFNKGGKKGIDIKLIIVDYLNYEIDSGLNFVYKGQKLKKPQMVINRSRNYGLSIQFENMGIPVFNNSNITLYGNNKILALGLVSALGINVMKTYSSLDLVENCPIIAKSRDGHGGKEVYLFENIAKIEDNPEIDKNKLIYQEKASSGNNDLRVYVVGNEIVCAMLRSSNEDFRSNYSMGGKACEYTLNSEETKMVNRIINKLGDVGYCGIDFIKHKDEWVFNEIEDAVGAKMVYTYTNYDPIEKYIDYIWERINNE